MSKAPLNRSHKRPLDRRVFLQAGAALGVCAASSPAFSANAGAAPRVIKIAAAVELADVVRSLASVYGKQLGLQIEVEATTSDLAVVRATRDKHLDGLFVSDDFSMSRLTSTRLVERFRVMEFAGNRMVIATHQPISAPAELVDSKYKTVIIADPKRSAAGRYAREALSMSGIWTEVNRKMAIAHHSRFALEFLARKQVDAAIVYRTDLVTKAGRDLQSIVFGGTVTHLMAPLAKSRALEETLAFMQFAAGPSARAALKQLNFELP